MAMKPFRAPDGMTAMARTRVLPKATLVGALPAQLRRHCPQSAMFGTPAAGGLRPASLQSYRTKGFFDLSDAAGLLGGSVAMGARQIPGSGPPRRRLHSGRFKSPIHTATTDVQRRRDVGHRASGFEEPHRLVSLEPR